MQTNTGSDERRDEVPHTAAEHRIIDFKVGDPGNPVNWSTARKSFIMSVGICCIFNSVFGTSLPSGDIDVLGAHFGITDNVQLVLPITIYQCGFICGYLTFGPLSETSANLPLLNHLVLTWLSYGRRLVVIGSSGGFAVFTLASIFVSSWPSYLGFRFLQGCCASSAISVTGGLYADIFDDPRKRGRANALFLCFSATLELDLAHLDCLHLFFVPVVFLPETYGLIILKRRAVKERSSYGPTCNTYAAIELKQKSCKEILLVFMARPIKMLVTEWIALFTCVFSGFATGIYFLFFRAYAIIFTGVYGLGQGASRLLLLPVAGGCLLGFLLSFVYDHVFYRAKALGKPWAMNEEYRRLPIACAGGPLCVVGLFWLGWTSVASIPVAVPTISGLVFGLGFYFILMALNNYLADAYKTYSASAMAAVSFARSVGGGFLSLAADAMYDALQFQSATSLLGFIMLAMCVVPFAFIRYGKAIRDHSKFCQQLEKAEGMLKELRTNDQVTWTRSGHVTVAEHTIAKTPSRPPCEV
ncbi:major facilitator superfamily domain-containing protein [Xylariales sp. AK1849]|nr:major facilitator superfamily domain-containing protein [Xylariales sp. AK1849]